MENSNDIKSIDIEERLKPSLTNATVNIVTYTFRMKYGKTQNCIFKSICTLSIL